MKFVRQYIQETVAASTPEEFDLRMNAIFAKASKSGKEPDIHYYPDGYSATVRYYIHTEIAETLAEEYELKGMGKTCYECPLYSLPEDRRVKYTHCDHGGKISANDPACNYYYECYGRQPVRTDKVIPIAK